MEALLSHAFDNLASKNSDKIRKGIKQVEGLLAQICSSKPSSHLGHNRRASVLPSSNDRESTPKALKDLPDDPAFREFFRLQEGFEYNVATHLLTTLNALLAYQPGTVDVHLASTLTLLQGILLLHPPSRTLFVKTAAMDTLLDLLDIANPPSVQQAAILVLVTALLGNPKAIRTFEQVDGLLSIKDLLRSEETTRSVKVCVMEFLYFYLMPEVPLPSSAERNGTALRIKRSEASLVSEDGDGDGGVSLHSNGTAGSFVDGGRGYDGDGEKRDRTIKSTREKQRLLGQYLSNVDDLVEDLRESNLFA